MKSIDFIYMYTSLVAIMIGVGKGGGGYQFLVFITKLLVTSLILSSERVVKNNDYKTKKKNKLTQIFVVNVIHMYILVTGKRGNVEINNSTQAGIEPGASRSKIQHSTE